MTDGKRPCAARKHGIDDSPYNRYVRVAGETRHFEYYTGSPFQYDAYARAITPEAAPDYDEEQALPAPRRKRGVVLRPRFVRLGNTRRGTSFMTYVLLIFIAAVAIAAMSANAIMTGKQDAVNTLREQSRKESENIKALKSTLYSMYDKEAVEKRAFELGMVKPANYRTEHILGVKMGFVESRSAVIDMSPSEIMRRAIEQTGINNGGR